MQIRRFVTALLIGALIGVESLANGFEKETFEEVMEGAVILGVGTCKISAGMFPCMKMLKNEKEYLVLVVDGRPIIIIRIIDWTVVWVAGTDI